MMQCLNSHKNTHMLDEIVEREDGEEIALTLDEAEFANHLSHVTCGVKVIDIRCVDPSNASRLVKFQSRDSSHVLSVI